MSGWQANSIIDVIIQRNRLRARDTEWLAKVKQKISGRVSIGGEKNLFHSSLLKSLLYKTGWNPPNMFLPSLGLSKTITVTLVEGFFGFATKNILWAACKAGWMDSRSFRVTLVGSAGSRTSIGTLMQCVSKHSSCLSLHQNTKGIFNTRRQFKTKINDRCNKRCFCKICSITSNICWGREKLLRACLFCCIRQISDCDSLGHSHNWNLGNFWKNKVLITKLQVHER